MLQFSVILFLLSFCYIVLKHFKHRYFVTLFNTSSIDIVTYCIRWFLEMYIIHSGPSHFVVFFHPNINIEHYWIASLETWKFICIQTLRVFIDQFVCISAKCDDLGCEQMNRTLFYMLMYVLVVFFFHTYTSMLNIQRAMLWCGFCCDKVYHLQLFVRL